MSKSRDQVALPTALGDYVPPEVLRRLTDKPFERRHWLAALNHLRSVRYLLSTYLPAHLAQEKVRRPVVGEIQGHWLDGSLLFSDVSGFTALSEHLANQGQEGTEQLTRAINRYFARMLEILSWSGGVLLKFAGDALLVYFPAYKDGEQACWAVRAAQRMMQAMEDFAAIPTPMGTVSLKMKIGISTGMFGALSVGSERRMEYVILGPTVARAMGAEGVATAGQIIGDSATAALYPAGSTDLGNGFFVLPTLSETTLDDYEIRAETQHTRATEGWYFTATEMVADMQLLIDQIRALAPYLPPELVERIIQTAEQRRLESEYRPATVLFVNVTGFEDILATLPAGDDASLLPLTRMLSDYFNAVQTVVTRYGGVITRIDPYSKGSKVLILFGAPVAHEDDPERGTRAALELMAELAALNERWQRSLPAGIKIRQRIGITQGLTFAGQVGAATRREYTVMGDDVNLAARLMSAATPGQILLAPRVYADVATRFAITALPAIRVKGKSEPIPVYQVNGLSHANPLDGHLRDLRPLFGRSTELAVVQERLERARNGNGSTLTLQGPAGIGKSHLAYTLAAHAIAGGVRVFLSECHAYTAEVPYAAWVSLLQTIFDFGTEDDLSQRSTQLAGALADLGLTRNSITDPLFTLLGLKNPTPPTFIPALPASESTPPHPAKRNGLFAQVEQKMTRPAATPSPAASPWKLAQERQKAQGGQMWQRLEARVTAREQERLFVAVGKLLERLAQHAPLMLIFENAQWMDAPSRALLSYPKDHSGAWPLFVLCLMRSEETAPPGATLPPEECLVLHPLDFEGTRDFVTYLLQREEPSAVAEEWAGHADFFDTIHRQSGGNPLFIEEIVRWLRRAGHLTPEAIQTALQSSNALQELIISRVDSLPYKERAVAKNASIVGDDFQAGDLFPLMETKTDAPHLIETLGGLITARMIVGTANDTDARHAFRQTLTREFIYNSLPFTKRRTQHARLAEYLEQRFAAKLTAYAELLAYHYTAAQKWLPAARYTLIAGDKARRRYALPQAGIYYQRSLEMLEHLPAETITPEVVTLQVCGHAGLGDVALLSGDFAAATIHYTDARRLATPEILPRLLVKLALVLPTQGRAAEAEICARQAWAMMPVGEDWVPAAVLAWLLWRADDPAAHEWIAHARPLAAAATDRWSAGIAALLTDLAGEWETAQRAYQALELNDAAALAACRQGDQRLRAGDRAAALAHYEVAATTWEQANDAPGLALVHYRRAEAQWRNGDPIAARSALETALVLLENAAESYRPDRAVIHTALDIVTANRTEDWPAWRWQAYDDACRILLLFPF